MTTSGRSIVTKALRRIGVVGQGQTPSVSNINDGYDELVDMVDEWATDNLTIAVTERAEFPLVANQITYTLGPGGDFNRVRPVVLDLISIISNSNPQQPLELKLDVLDLGQWQGLPVKKTYSALPTKVYRDYANPLMNLQFWPIANVGTLKCALYCPTALAQLTGLDVAYIVAPGYKSALYNNLAFRLCDFFGKTPPVTLPKLADDSLANIRRANIRPQIIPVDAAIIGRSDRFNFHTGEPL